MSFLDAVILTVPPLLILLRWKREPRWLASIRYIVAILVVWLVVIIDAYNGTQIRISEARAHGEILLGDTGANAAALLVGWIPGVIYVALLSAGRRLWFWVNKRRQV